MKTRTLFLLLLTIGQAIIIFGLVRRNKDKQALIDEYAENRTLNAEVVDTYFAKDSTPHEVIRERFLRSTETVYLIDSAKLDSIARVLKVKERQIEELLTVKATLEGEVKAASVTVDSLMNKTYTFLTPYLNAKFTERDTMLRYRYNAKIGIVKHWDRKGLLGPIYHYIDLSAEDKNMTINGLEQFTIRQRDKATPWGIGFHAGYYFDPETGEFRPAIGAGVSYNIIRF